MHLIHSALRDLNETPGNYPFKDHSELQLRYQAYTETCNKHRQHIAEIQKRFPGWMPPFRQHIDHGS